MSAPMNDQSFISGSLHDMHFHVPEQPAPPPVPAGRNRASHFRLWLPAIGGLALDLWSKNWAVTHLSTDRPHVVIDGLLNLRLSLNPGALFGLGAGLAPIFVGASVLALLFVLYLFWQSTSRHYSLHVALGLVLGGAIGNLYDRTVEKAYVVQRPDGYRDVCELHGVGRHQQEVEVGDFGTGRNRRTYNLNEVRAGYMPVVRDFLSIEMQIAGFRVWPWIFNVADVLLVAGVSLLMLNFWSDHRAERAASRAAAAGEGASRSTG